MDAQDPVLARLVARVDSARELHAPLEIRGGGTKLFLGGTPAGEPLDMTGLTGITSYEPTELVVTARAGTRLSDLESALEEHGQCLPFEPPRFAAGGTLGGMVASGLSGPARASIGSVRDHVLGVTLLNGRGEVLTFGGQVTKNVAGYDVSRLMVGSFGVLGILCEVSIKVLPVSIASATLRFDWDETRALEQLVSCGKPGDCICAWPARAPPWRQPVRGWAVNEWTQRGRRTGGPVSGIRARNSSSSTMHAWRAASHCGGCPYPRSPARSRFRASNSSNGMVRNAGGKPPLPRRRFRAQPPVRAAMPR